MKKVFLIHGFEGSPNGGWRPWLMAELAKKDIYACSLSMPNPDKPKLSEWLEEIKRHVSKNKKDDIYLVGHSLGGTAILRYLETYKDSNIKGIISVSAPCEKTNNKKIDGFLKDEFNFKKIKSRIDKIVIIHGDNDPVVPISDAQKIAKELNGKLILIPNGQHLNGSAGFLQLPECLNGLMKMMK